MNAKKILPMLFLAGLVCSHGAAQNRISVSKFSGNDIAGVVVAPFFDVEIRQRDTPGAFFDMDERLASYLV